MSSELWQNVFENDNNDVDSNFNYFLNTYLHIFYSCFPRISAKKTATNKQWITKGIINSCKRKKELFLLTRNNNDVQLKECYMRYSEILSKVIRTAKTLHLNNQIIHSNNKIKTMWNIIKHETVGHNIKHDKVNISNTDKKYNESITAEIFKKYFLTVANNISCNIMGSQNQFQSSAKDSLSFLSQAFNFPFTNIITIYPQGKENKLSTPSHVKTCVGMMRFL